MRKKIMMAMLGITSGVASFAQDSIKTTILREVVFSESREEKPLLEVPRSATVISRDAIEKTIYNSVGELLSAQEGIYVVGSNQTPGTNQSIFMRGANGNQVAVMIDGKRITDPSSPNASIDLSELSLTNVERIEIIRGSHTTVFGGAAIGGVINIITRKGSSEGFHGNASLQAATFGEKSFGLSEQVDLNYTAKNGFYVSGSLFNQNVNGLDASVKTGEGTFSTNDDDDFTKTDGSVKLGINKGKVDGSISYKKGYQDAEIDGGAFSDDDNNWLTFERSIADYNLKYTLTNNSSLTILGSYSNSHRINKNDSSVVDESGATDQSYFKGNYRGELHTHELQYNYAVENFTVMAGAGLFSEDMRFKTYFFSNAFGAFEQITNYDTISTRTTTTYLFGKLGYQAGPLGISGGARFSHHETFGKFFTFELNPSYKFSDALLFLSVSSGFNAPSLYQLYDPSKDFGSYTSRGNRLLDPERSISFEAGAKKEFKGGSFFTLSAFLTSVKGAIEYVNLWDGAQNLADLDYSHYRGDVYLNIARQQSAGIELQTHIVFTPRLALNGNFTLMDAEFSTHETDLSGEQTGNHHVQLYSNGIFIDGDDKDALQRRPAKMGNAQLRYSVFDSFNIYLGYRYADSRYDAVYDPSLGPFGALGKADVDAYHLLDVGGMWSVNEHFALHLKVDNILDEQYAEILGFQTRGRSAYLKLSYKW